MENKWWLIDVNEFRQIFWSKLQNLKLIGPLDVEHIILNTPKVDAVEVVHGKWERKKHKIFGNSYDYVCSICGCDYALAEYNYCPNCGAQMDEEVQE